MIRFSCVLIAAYNFKVILQTWALASHYLFKIGGVSSELFGIVLTGVMVCFMAVHSIRLVMLNPAARKPQIIISSINPLLHIMLLLFVMANIVPLEKALPINFLFITRGFFAFLDLLVVYFMTRKNTIGKFILAEEQRTHTKILKQAASI